jgi:hypothetical protein
MKFCFLVVVGSELGLAPVRQVLHRLSLSASPKLLFKCSVLMGSFVLKLEGIIIYAKGA